jgi:LysM repeat protein
VCLVPVLESSLYKWGAGTSDVISSTQILQTNEFFCFIISEFLKANVESLMQIVKSVTESHTGDLSFAFVLKMCVLIETVPKESALLTSAVVKYPGVIVAVRILWTDGVCCMLS